MNKNHTKIGLFLGLVFGLILLSNPLMESFRAGSPGTPPITHPNPHNLLRGDIIFMDTAFQEVIINKTIDNIEYNSNDHCTLYLGWEAHDHCGIYTEDYWCIGAGVFGVHFHQLSDVMIPTNHKNFQIARVKNATRAQINLAINWAKSHENDSYQDWSIPLPGFGPQKCNDPNCPSHPLISDKWYCSEFVWAAYYNQGIDIDKNGWNYAPWFPFQSVNMGVPTDPPFFVIEELLTDYAYKNEIQMDDDIQEIPWI